VTKRGTPKADAQRAIVRMLRMVRAWGSK